MEVLRDWVSQWDGGGGLLDEAELGLAFTGFGGSERADFEEAAGFGEVGGGLQP